MVFDDEGNPLEVRPKVVNEGVAPHRRPFKKPLKDANPQTFEAYRRFTKHQSVGAAIPTGRGGAAGLTFQPSNELRGELKNDPGCLGFLGVF